MIVLAQLLVASNGRNARVVNDWLTLYGKGTRMPATHRTRQTRQLHTAWLPTKLSAGEGLYRAVRAACYSALLGKQRPKDMAPVIDKAVRAAVKALSRPKAHG